MFAFAPWLVFLAPATALPSPPQALQSIVGTWKSDGVVSTCQWSPQHSWVVCDQKGTADGKPIDVLCVYGYSPTRKAYVFFAVPEGSKTPFGSTVRIECNKWTYVANDADEAKKFKTTNEFTSHDSYKWEVLQSSDGEHWSVVKSGTSRRVN